MGRHPFCLLLQERQPPWKFFQKFTPHAIPDASIPGLTPRQRPPRMRKKYPEGAAIMQLFTIEKKPREWMITWSENRLRWVLFYYLVGLIVSSIATFLEEMFFPVDLTYLSKSVAVTVLVPLLTVLVSILSARRADARRTDTASSEGA